MSQFGAVLSPTVNAQFLLGAEVIQRRQTVVCREQSSWHTVFSVRIESAVGELPDCVSACVKIPGDGAWFLDANRDLVPLSATVRPPWPVGCFVVVRLAGRFSKLLLIRTFISSFACKRTACRLLSFCVTKDLAA